MKSLIAAAALAASFVLVEGWDDPAHAASCAPRDVVVERLAERYGESRQSMGLGANNAVVEVFASLETGTWTITVTSVHGLTCLVASGQSFEVLGEDITPGEDM